MRQSHISTVFGGIVSFPMELLQSPPWTQDGTLDSSSFVLSSDALELVSKNAHSVLQEVLYVNSECIAFIHRLPFKFKRRVVAKCYPAPILFMVSTHADLP